LISLSLEQAVLAWLQLTTPSKWIALSVSFKRILLAIKKNFGTKALLLGKIEFNTMISTYRNSSKPQINNGRKFNKNLERANPSSTKKVLYGLETKMLTPDKETSNLLIKLWEWSTPIFNIVRRRYNLFTWNISCKSRPNT
jgi:hypothetical protein